MNTVTVNPNIAEYLPTWYRRIADYMQIMAAEGQMLQTAESAMTAVHENFFISTMNEAAIEEWENTFGIIPNAATETLEFRRARILNRIGLRPPYTLNFLRQKLDELIGAGEYTVEVDEQNFTLTVESAADNQQWEIEVAYSINKMKPAHIVYINRPYLRDGILLNETIALSRRIYNYRLGSWGLGISPFADLEEIGVIKMASTPSIQNELLNGVAGFVLSDIASARLNGSIVISDITKASSDNTVTVTYNVLPADTSEITSVELLDASGNVLTAATIYVPVTQPTIMEHTIPVQEGVNE